MSLKRKTATSRLNNSGCIKLLLTLALAQGFTLSPCGAMVETNDSPMQREEPLTLSNEKAANLLTPQRTFSLAACFDKAVSNNREIATAGSTLPISKAAIRIAGAIPNPNFSLLYGWGYQFTIILAGQPQQFGWQFDIQTAGKRTKKLNLARANYRVNQYQIAQLMFDIHNRVRRAYGELAAAEAYSELIESQRKVALELVRVASKRYEAGKAAKAEQLQAELGVLQFDTQRNQAQTRLQQASAALAQLIGEIPRHMEVIDVDDNGIFKLSAQHTDLVPSPKRPLPPLAQLLPVAYKERPDMLVAIQQKYADNKALTLAKAQRIPDLFIDSGYQFTTFEKHQPYNLFSPASNPNATVPNSPGCYINASIENPIFYQHQGEIAQAKATLLQDSDQIKQLKAQIATDIVTAYESVVGTRANIYQFQNALIPQAAKVSAQAFRRYQVGKADLSSAILAREQYQQILSAYFDSVAAYQNAWADLEKAIGVSLQL